MSHLVWELKARLLEVSHGLQRIELTARVDGLTWGHHPQVDILLLCSLDLLLLLLKQLNLLLDSQLFHYHEDGSLVALAVEREGEVAEGN